jgi:hypothetical protein
MFRLPKNARPSKPSKAEIVLVISKILYPNLSTTRPKINEPNNTPTGRNVTKDEAPTVSRAYLAVREGKTEPITINAIPKKAIPIHAAIYTKVLLYFILFVI